MIRPRTLPHALVASAVVPLSTAIILLGGLCMVVRRHTIAQLIGWLILENGVFLGAITLDATFPFIVEAGIFLDLVAARADHDHVRLRARGPAGDGERRRS